MTALRARLGGLADRACSGGDDAGNAIVEFLGAALLLLVPLVYLVLVLGRLQAATFATAGAAREAARAYTAALAPAYAADVTAGAVEVDGVALVEVTVRAPMPVIGLLGPSGTLTVRGHALAEQP